MSADILDLKGRLNRQPDQPTADPAGFDPIAELQRMKTVDVIEQTARVIGILDRDMRDERERHSAEMYRIQTAVLDLADQLAKFAETMRTIR